MNKKKESGLLWQVIGEYDALLVTRYFVFVAQELLGQLLLDERVDETQKRHAKYHDGLVLFQALTKRRHKIVAHPTRVIQLVQGYKLLLLLSQWGGTIDGGRKIEKLKNFNK